MNDDEIIKQYEEYLLKFILDNNQNCLQKVLKLIESYTKKTKKFNIDVKAMIKFLI